LGVGVGLVALRWGIGNGNPAPWQGQQPSFALIKTFYGCGPVDMGFGMGMGMPVEMEAGSGSGTGMRMPMPMNGAFFCGAVGALKCQMF